MSYANDMPAAPTTTRPVPAESVERAPARPASPLAGDLRIAVMRLARRLRSERADFDLSLTQMSALASLERSGPTTPGHLATLERVKPPSMTRILAGLVDQGLVLRTPHPTDGRQVLVEVTDEARALLKTDRRRREAWLAQRLAALAPDKRRALREVIPILEELVSE
jgi:DNA-binding MarR family transcriptional regulator